jgi:type I restriction-modification system DNA methylase subunit
MNYITGFIFYRYLSEQLAEYVERDLKGEGLLYYRDSKDLNNEEREREREEISRTYKDYSIKHYGYFLDPKYS